MRILLDITRSVARARLPAATGIDRVERAYIDRALRCGALFLCGIDRTQYLVGPTPVRGLIRWLDGAGPAPARDLRAFNPLRDARLARAEALIRRGSLASAPASDRQAIAAMLRRAAPGTYLNVGHDNLSPEVMGGAAAAGLARIALIHDLIPLEHPEFARPETPARFRAKLDVAREADLLLAISADTGRRLGRLGDGAMPSVRVALPGISRPRAFPVEANPSGGFVCLGTIEPRKNHALLLDIWERFWHEHGPDSPILHIIGRRGWCNEAVFRTLDSAPFMGRTVIEHGALDDDGVAVLLSRARALLFPSLAEGFGLPLAEALARGVPVLASDLPVLREAGGDVPDWLPPHDAEAWRRAIRDHAAEPSARRAAQKARLDGWRAPCWRAHFRTVRDAMGTFPTLPALDNQDHPEQAG